MKLITVEAFFTSDEIGTAMDAVQTQVETVSAMEGCAAFAVYQSKTAIAIVQKWHSMQHFDSYRGSAVFGDLIAALKPLMAAPPVTTIADVDT